MSTISRAASQLRSYHAVGVLGAGVSASEYPMTPDLPPLVWMALNADPGARAKVADQIGKKDTTAKALIGSDRNALEFAWRGIAASKEARRVFQQAFVDLDLEREPTAAQFALAQMLRGSVLEYVISFNWDTALERAYEQLYGVDVPPGLLAKPHGDANRPDLSWTLPHEAGVITQDVLLRLEHLASKPSTNFFPNRMVLGTLAITVYVA